MKYYIIPFLSWLAVVAYCSPWWEGDQLLHLMLYPGALLWFCIVWIALLIHGFFFALSIKRQNRLWKHHLLAVLLIIGSYTAVTVLMNKGYVLLN